MEFILPIVWLAASLISFIIAMFYNADCGCSCGCDCHLPLGAERKELEEQASKREYNDNASASKKWFNFGWLGAALFIAYQLHIMLIG
jgi:hypothetical protein